MLSTPGAQRGPLFWPAIQANEVMTGRARGHPRGATGREPPMRREHSSKQIQVGDTGSMMGAVAGRESLLAFESCEAEQHAPCRGRRGCQHPRQGKRRSQRGWRLAHGQWARGAVGRHGVKACTGARGRGRCWGRAGAWHCLPARRQRSASRRLGRGPSVIRAGAKLTFAAAAERPWWSRKCLGRWRGAAGQPPKRQPTAEAHHHQLLPLDAAWTSKASPAPRRHSTCALLSLTACFV